jgi:hypothetical protein
MGVAFAPPVAGGRHAHQARVLPVLHVAHEDAVLDQHGLARRRALVVHGDRAAPVGDRAVVEHRHAGGGDALAHQPGEGRLLLAVEIALQPVADRLVQQDAGPAGAERPRPSRPRARARPRGSPRRCAAPRAPCLPSGGAPAGRQPDPPAAARAADSRRPFSSTMTLTLSRTMGRMSAARALGRRITTSWWLSGERGADLHHARVERAGEGVDLAQRVELHGERPRPPSGRRRCRAACWCRRRLASVPPPSPTASRAVSAARAARPRRSRWNGRSPPPRPSPRAGRTLGRVVAGVLHPAVVEDQRLGPAAFQEQARHPRRRRWPPAAPQRRGFVEMGVEWAEGARRMNFQPGVTELANDIRALDTFLLVIATAIVLFVTALLAWTIVRHNARPTRTRPPSPTTPRSR